jgi:two-component system LytT family response regulator
MSIYTAIIVDDEYWARMTLRHKLNEVPEVEIIGEADSLDAAIETLNEKSPDILFLDIQLNDGTGFDLLNRVEFKGKVIFVTAYDSYAIRAFEINALDYLMKPISDKRLKSAVERINMENIPDENAGYLNLNPDDRIMATHRDFIHFIKVSDIVLISSAKDYSCVRNNEKQEYLVTKTMSEWEQRLPDTNFCRIHRSYIINFDYIRETKKLSSNAADIYLKDIDKPFRVSRSYYHLLKERYI